MILTSIFLERQLEVMNVISIVKTTIRDTKQGEVSFDFKMKIKVTVFNQPGFRAG